MMRGRGRAIGWAGSTCFGVGALLLGVACGSSEPGGAHPHASAPPSASAAPVASASGAPSAIPSAIASASGPPVQVGCDEGPPAKCTKVAANASVQVSVCDETDGQISPRVHDLGGRALYPYFFEADPKKRSAVSAQFKDVTGDGVDDILLRSPAPEGMAASCSYFFDGAKLGCWSDNPTESAARSLGRSFAASLVRSGDPWKAVSAETGPIPQETACALITSARTPAGFKTHATPDAEIVTYLEPSQPACPTFPTDGPRGVTKARLEGLAPPSSCTEIVCAADYPFCFNAGPDGPGGEYYLFTKDAKGSYLIRAIATYAGS